MGSPDAPVELVEYASTTCAACQHFHASVLPELAASYILTGDARFVFRNYPTSPMPAASAGAALARCAGSQRYYDVVAELFTRQTEIVAASRFGEISGVLQNIGARHGLSAAEVDACIEDPATLAYISAEADHAPAGANPPLLLLNGQRLEDLSLEGVRRAIDTALAALRLQETLALASGDLAPLQPDPPYADPHNQ